MTKRLSLTEKHERRKERQGLKSQRDLFSEAAKLTEAEVLGGSRVLLGSRASVAQESGLQNQLDLEWGPLSGPIFERSLNVGVVLDESYFPGVPYAQPYYNTVEYINYRDHMDTETRTTFLLLVAFSLKSDGL
jgi:hypothetical protein